MKNDYEDNRLYLAELAEITTEQKMELLNAKEEKKDRQTYRKEDPQLVFPKKERKKSERRVETKKVEGRKSSKTKSG